MKEKSLDLFLLLVIPLSVSPSLSHADVLHHEGSCCGNTTAVQFLRSLTVLDLTESRDYKHSPKSKKNKRRLLITSIFSLDVCVEETKIFT